MFLKHCGALVMIYVAGDPEFESESSMFYREMITFRYQFSCFSAPVASPAQRYAVFSTSTRAFKAVTTLNHNRKGSHPSESLG